MKPELQGVEIESPRRRDHDLTVYDAALGQLLQQRLVQLREIAVERPQVAALDVQVGAATIDDRAESVPLGLEEEVPVGGQGLCQRGEHGLDRGRDREGAGAGTHRHSIAR